MDKEKSTLEYLRRICSAREYCRKDVYDKAFKRLEDAAAASRLVDSLVEDGFVSEERYASAFARDKSAIAGWGPMKIRNALRIKGVSSDIISDALAQIDVSRADDKLLKVMQIKSRQLEGDPQIRLKLLRFALSRGFDYEKVSEMMDTILQK